MLWLALLTGLRIQCVQEPVLRHAVYLIRFQYVKGRTAEWSRVRIAKIEEVVLRGIEFEFQELQAIVQLLRLGIQRPERYFENGRLQEYHEQRPLVRPVRVLFVVGLPFLVQFELAACYYVALLACPRFLAFRLV